MRNYSRLASENQKLHISLAQMEGAFSSKMIDLESKVTAVSNENQIIKTELKDSHNVIKIKESMLEDQNDTIKTLKINLENKAREMNKVSNELEKVTDSYEEQEEKQHIASKDLRQEVRNVVINLRSKFWRLTNLIIET